MFHLTRRANEGIRWPMNERASRRSGQFEGRIYVFLKEVFFLWKVL